MSDGGLLFDSHVHFGRDVPDGEVAATLDRAAAAGVTRMVAVGGSGELNDGAVRAARLRPEAVRFALGFDRDHVAGREGVTAGRDLEALLDRHAGPALAAVGEIGLDYHYSPETRPQQIEGMRGQLEVARRRGLPVIIHSRDADADTLDLLGEHARLRGGRQDGLGVLHCFTGTAEFATALVALGYFISFSGIVTFANADRLRSVAARIPLTTLLIETDTPYLAPVPHRGKTNEPAFVRHVAETLARVRGEAVERIAAATRQNAGRLFGWEA